MKKIFMQLGQRILKYKKRLIYGALALFVGQICFFGLGGIGLQNEVFADEGEKSADVQTDLMTKLYTLEATMSKLVYIVMYPLLMVAGKLVDNSLVYGEDFGFDVVLWHLWKIVRNIANFGLGFIFIYNIFGYILTWKEEYGRKKLLPKALIAGVGIQASWFAMAALIDISTIMAYGIGGLPITVLGSSNQDDLKFNPYILNTVVNVDANDVDTYHIYLSNKEGNKFISTCKTFVYSATGDNGERVVKELIFTPEMAYYKSGENECYQTIPHLCHIGDQVYKFTSPNEREGLEGVKCEDFKNYQNEKNTKDTELKAGYLASELSGITEAISWGTLLLFGQTGSYFGLDEGSQNIGFQWGSYRLKDILSGSYVGVFGSLYGSLLNAGQYLRVSATSEENNQYVNVLNIALSLGHMIAISIPLMVMLVVFMIRICVLWVAIALSPIIVLLKSFGLEKHIDGLGVDFLKYLKVENLIGIIISPAIICFAISISTILVRVISAENWEMVGGINGKILGGLVDLSIAGVGISMGKMFVSIIGIAITWFLVWAAVKANEIGKKSAIVNSLEEFAKSALGSVPIVPIPNLEKGGISWTGVNAIKELPGRISSNVKDKFNNNDALEDLVDPGRVQTRQVDAFKNKITGDFRPTPGVNWAKQKIAIRPDNYNEGGRPYEYGLMDVPVTRQEEIINAINGLDQEKRDAFGKSAETIVLPKGTYVYTVREEKEKIDGKEVTKKIGKYEKQ